jgi:hypothetical protein
MLVLLNSCNSGRLGSFVFGEPLFTPLLRGAHLVTAGGGNQVTFGTADGSYFFTAILNGLAGGADPLRTVPGAATDAAMRGDGAIAVSELHSYLEAEIWRLRNGSVTPRLVTMLPDASDGSFYFFNREFLLDRGAEVAYEPPRPGEITFGAPARPADPTAASAAPDTAEVASRETSDSARSPAAGRTPRGVWVGNGAFVLDAFAVELEIAEGCSMNAPCGMIAVPDVPCRGRLTLIDSRPEGFEFSVDDFDAASDQEKCRPGGGEVLKLLPDGTLSLHRHLFRRDRDTEARQVGRISRAEVPRPNRRATGLARAANGARMRAWLD